MINEAPKRWMMMVVAAAMPLALSACAHKPVINPASPIASQVEAAAADKGGAYPKFSQVPSMPKDVRTAKQWKDSVVGVETARDKLAAETAPDTFTLNDTDAFAANARAQLAGAGKAPGEEAATKAADDFARAARQRATPPPSKR